MRAKRPTSPTGRRIRTRRISPGRRDPGAADAPDPSTPERADGDEPNYDSCFDDLNLELSDSHHEPDPILESSGTSQAPRPTEPATPAGSSRAGKPPRTSEVFRAAGVAAAETDPEARPRSGRSGRGSEAPASVATQPAASPRDLALPAARANRASNRAPVTTRLPSREYPGFCSCF